VRAAYVPADFEARWQQRWREERVYAASTTPDPDRDAYIFAAAPFTSGNIHMGHVRSYTIADAYARFRRAAGDSVLFSIGFDSFGLPAELEAIKRGMPTRAWVERCCEQMRAQMARMGFSFDWDREFVSSEPEFYRWSQWLFLAFLERDLVYRATARVDYCESCRTTLASLQVEDGCCWRCHTPVRAETRAQWYLRVSAYIPENERRLDERPGADRGWLASQRTALGRVDGVEAQARAADGRTLWVFTPHADAVAQAQFVAISPNHPQIDAWASDTADDALRGEGWGRVARSADDAPVLDAGCTLELAGLAAPLPLVITPAVDGRFGTTAVLGIPQVDRTDEILARRIATAPPAGGAGAALSLRPAVRYRKRDFTISRQRSWGAPIPIVHCEKCGIVPLAMGDLPVLLPEDLQPTGEGNPLAEHETFLATSCPRCGADARRETDTLDCHLDGIWMWLPICVPKEGRDALFDHAELQRWMPGKRQIWGADGGGYLSDQRTIAKALRDLGKLAQVTDGEPFGETLMHEMVQLDGRKMSKHLGNVVDPDTLVAQVGADVVRLAVLVAAAPRRPLTWTESAVRRSQDFLSELWAYAQPRLAAAAPPPAPDAAIEPSDALRRRLQRWCEAAVRNVTVELDELEMHLAAENVMRLFANVQKFEARARERRGELDAHDREAVVIALRLVLRMLAPFAPHACEELWELAGGPGLVGELPWPAPEAVEPAPREPLPAT
jgi:leucyl-tRNA synthetase